MNTLSEFSLNFENIILMNLWNDTIEKVWYCLKYKLILYLLKTTNNVSGVLSRANDIKLRIYEL